MYSQHGEDDLVLSMFPNGYRGSMVEIGAYHHTKLSNSRRFIELGWKAMLIEPNPLAMAELFRFHSKNPLVTLVSGALMDRRQMQFYITEDAVSTGDPETFKKWSGTAEYMGPLYVQALCWEWFLGWCALNSPDFISIDAEGMSVPILRKLMLSAAPNPKVICIEFDSWPAVVCQLAGEHGYRIEVDETANGTNMVLVR